MYSYFTAKQTLREKLQSPNVRSFKPMFPHNRGVSSMSELDMQMTDACTNSEELQLKVYSSGC